MGFIRGAKACGKTESAKQIAGNILNVDCDEQYNGDWIACEIKLGTGQIDQAATNLKKLASIIDLNRVNPPKSLNIITGTGISYTRADGINVISVGSLGF